MSYKEQATTLCKKMADIGMVKESLLATTLQWGSATAILTTIIILLSKKNNSSVTIGNLKAVALGFLFGAGAGVGSYYLCWGLQKHAERKALKA